MNCITNKDYLVTCNKTGESFKLQCLSPGLTPDKNDILLPGAVADFYGAYKGKLGVWSFTKGVTVTEYISRKEQRKLNSRPWYVKLYHFAIQKKN